MENNRVIFKGDVEGLIIILDDKIEFEIIKEELKFKFNQAGDFFQDDMLVRIKLGKRELSDEQKKELIRIFKGQAGLSVIEFINDGHRFNKLNEENSTLLIKKTIRSGQSIKYEGNIIIQGDVNPGAEIIAEGDIVVMGNFRGIAHAGSKGNVNSTISAFRLEPTQIRIANYISRAPDIPEASPNRPEIAFVKDKYIMLDYLGK